MRVFIWGMLRAASESKLAPLTYLNVSHLNPTSELKMSLPSKSRIDKAGLALAKAKFKDEVDYIELEESFDEYRKAHLQPLSETTLELQLLLANYGAPYYIAQRLKRKPQIVRKLNRLSVRLTQLQDIGGCRIIVHRNSDVDKVFKYLTESVNSQNIFTIDRTTDYREKGRDDTGYRGRIQPVDATH